MADVVDVFELTGRTDTERFFMVKGAESPEEVTNAVLELAPKGSRHPWNGALRAREPIVVSRPALKTWRVRVSYADDGAIRYEEGEKPVDAVQ